MPTDTAPDTFVLRVPDAWQELPLDPASVRDTVHALGLPADDVATRRLTLLLERNASLVAEMGVVYAAAYVEALPPEPESDDDGGGGGVQGEQTLMATVALVTGRAEDLGLPQVPFEALHAASDREPSASCQQLQAPEAFELPGGRCVHDLSVLDIADAASRTTIRLLRDRYLLLIGGGAGFAMLDFVTPNLAVADEFVSLFRTIAETLEFVAA